MKRLFKFRYPKTIGMIIAVILAYIIFSNPAVEEFISGLGNLGYIGVFIGGLFFTFGFTTPFAVGFFITLDPANIWLAGILGGMGALIGDLLIFQFIRMSFMDEFGRLKKTKLIKSTEKLANGFLNHHLKTYLVYAFAGIIIASPLPDEIGVAMLAGFTKLKAWKLALISFVMNALGILVLLWI